MKTWVRNPSIDTLRGVAILLVMMHHFNIAYSLQDTTLADLFSGPLLLLSGRLSAAVGRVCLDSLNAAIRKRYARAPMVA
ncbi:hypothetical protein CEY04_10805 [Achromobacter sp. HZ28]|nr:hypothetical protein CEY05_21175 [Achromobacter sp. HZ34]OWT79463.1 hypothetical protein CEY04_10805 [Achromobacter sp. HZ28]